MTGDVNTPDGIDTEGKAVPPYEGRRESADAGDERKSVRDDARVGGATGPAEDGDPKAADPGQTPGGATGSPAEERPADTAPGTEPADDGVGPAHEPGVGRAEDQA
jgi:hypothetical protein